MQIKKLLPGLLAVTVLPLLPASAADNANWPGHQPGPANPSIRLLSEFRPLGGVSNNLEHPAFNAVPNTPELALAPLNFAPGTAGGLISGPNPRTISDVISGGTGSDGEDGETDDTVASAWLYVFGQFVDHDLDLSSTPTNSPAINIVVPVGDTVFKPGTTIDMTRVVRSSVTGTTINTTAGYLDLSQLYGSTAVEVASLRNADGTLKSSNDGQALPIINGGFVTGDPRVMENPELGAVTILFMREHNYWARALKAMNPGWSGDELYNMAKAITTAEYQNIIYTEYLPVLLGPVLGAYQGYQPRVNAQISQEFSTAAFRMGHSEVSDTQEGLDNNGNVVFSQSLSQAFFNSAAMDVSNGINPLLRSLGADFSQATDVYAVPVLRNLLFAPLPGGDVDELDLIAIDIQRERDAGIATLNQTRKAIGLRPYNSFAQLTTDPVTQANFAAVYGNINNVDLFMGGLAETHVAGAVVGPTFEAIIAGQFQALRAGDRFFWLNQGFDKNTTAMIAKTTLTEILLRNTDTTSAQPNLFIEASVPTHVKHHVSPFPSH